jgi:CxxC motif-containing protein
MKYKVICIILLAVLQNSILAQTNYFIWLQSDQQQYFQVELQGKAYESSQAGYVVIPKLPSGLYELKVYPGADKKQQQAFNIQIGQQDRGFAIKQRDGQWVLMDLFDFQTVQSINISQGKVTESQPTKQESPKDVSQGEVKVNKAIPQSANITSSVMEEKKENKQELLKDEPKLEESVIKAPVKKGDPNIRRTYDKKTPQGIDRVYIDHSGGESDTIIIFIPDPQKETNTKNWIFQPQSPLLTRISIQIIEAVIFRKEELWQNS